MTTKGDKDQPGRWRGDEVEDQPGGEAERAADRAEGNAPVRADAESKRLRREGTAAEPASEGDAKESQGGGPKKR
jgi:hypothetical protein